MLPCAYVPFGLPVPTEKAVIMGRCSGRAFWGAVFFKRGRRFYSRTVALSPVNT